MDGGLYVFRPDLQNPDFPNETSLEMSQVVVIPVQHHIQIVTRDSDDRVGLEYFRAALDKEGVSSPCGWDKWISSESIDLQKDV